jgi:hypothetical protein
MLWYATADLQLDWHVQLLAAQVAAPGSAMSAPGHAVICTADLQLDRHLHHLATSSKRKCH